MEAYRLNSRIVEDDKEFLVQTENDADKGIIRTSVFVNGEYLDSNIIPHQGEYSDEQVLDLVRTAHGEKKSEIEFLLKNFREVQENGSPEMMCQLGKAMYYKKMFAESTHLLNTAVKLNPEMHEAFFYLSQTERASGEIKASVKSAKEAVRLKPDFADYRNNLGEAYLKAEDWRKALEEFETAINKNVYYADAYFNKAVAILVNAVKRDDDELYEDYKALTTQFLEKAVLTDPFFQTAQYEEAMMALDKDDPSRAMQLLNEVRWMKADKVRGEKSAHFQKYLLNTDWLSQGDIEGRINTLEREITRNPGYVDLYYELAVCKLYQAKICWKEGIENFNKALRINSNLKKARMASELAEEEYLKLTDIVFDITEKIK